MRRYDRLDGSLVDRIVVCINELAPIEARSPYFTEELAASIITAATRSGIESIGT